MCTHTHTHTLTYMYTCAEYPTNKTSRFKKNIITFFNFKNKSTEDEETCYICTLLYNVNFKDKNISENENDLNLKMQLTA